MKVSNLILILILLSGCQSNRFIEIAEEESTSFLEPITKDKYIYTIYGFYIDKDNLSIDKDNIKYKVLFDNRNNVSLIKKKYQTNTEFDSLYPSYIEHIGEVECSNKKNTAIVNRLDTKMNIIISQKILQESLVSEKLCFINQLTREY
jgi:hypothetical protein